MMASFELAWRYIEQRLIGTPALVLIGVLIALRWFRHDVSALLAGSDPTHDTRRIQVGITAAAVGAALLHMVAPSLAIDHITLTLLAAAGVPWLITLFKEIELGGVKVKFRDLEEASRRASAAGLLELKPKAVAKQRYSFETVADNDPNLALAGLRIEIERRLTGLATASGLPVERSSVSYLLKRLDANDVLSGEQRRVLDNMVGLLNNAAHGARVDPAGALWALNVGPQLLATLDSLIAEQRSRELRADKPSDGKDTSRKSNEDLLAKLTRLRESGVQDPDLDLFLGVLRSEADVVKKAIEEGADVNVTDVALLERYRQRLNTIH